MCPVWYSNLLWFLIYKMLVTPNNVPAKYELNSSPCISTLYVQQLVRVIIKQLATILACTAVNNHWTGLVEWTAEMDYCMD